MKLTPLLVQRLADTSAEEVRRNHGQCIAELQGRPATAIEVIEIDLVDGVAKRIPHGLGRAPLGVFPSAIRGAVSSGRIVESFDVDRSKAVVLTASGFGATITIGLLVL